MPDLTLKRPPQFHPGDRVRDPIWPDNVLTVREVADDGTVTCEDAHGSSITLPERWTWDLLKVAPEPAND